MKFMFNNSESNIKVEYEGWDPSLKQKRIAEDNTEHIFVLSPDGSNVRCRYSLLNGVFYGECTVVSKTVNFKIKSYAKDFVSCSQLLKENTMSRLNTWKQLRFFELAADSSYYDRVG